METPEKRCYGTSNIRTIEGQIDRAEGKEELHNNTGS